MNYTLPTMTPQLSLYAHSDALIEQFNDVLLHSTSYLPTSEQLMHMDPDQMASIFNYWVQLINSPEIRIAKVDRVILHDLTIQLNQFVANHELVHEFKSRFRSHETLFLLSSFVSVEISHIINETVPEHLLHYYEQTKLNTPYYLLTNDDLDRRDVHTLFTFRKTFVAQLHTPDMRKKLNLTVYNAIKQTRQLLATQLSR